MHFGASGVVIHKLLQDGFGGHDKRVHRTITFGALICTIAVPLMHSVSMEVEGSLARSRILTGLGWFVLSQAVGGLFFSTLVPERFKPGAFDAFGKSHEWMHWAVVVGIILFYDVARLAFTHRHAISSRDGTC